MPDFAAASAGVAAILEQVAAIEPVEDEHPCPFCDGYGHIVTPDNVAICGCMADRKRRALPNRYRREYLDRLGSWSTKELNKVLGIRPEVGILPAVRKVFRGHREAHPDCYSLGLCGPTGVGKTMVLHWYLLALSKALLRPAWFINARYLARLFAAAYRTGEGNRHALHAIEVLEEACLDENTVVGFDDIAGCVEEGAAKRFVEGHLNTRFDRGAPTWFTSNLDREELSTRYEAFVMERILSGGEYMCLIQIPKGTPDMRRPEID